MSKPPRLSPAQSNITWPLAAGLCLVGASALAQQEGGTLSTVTVTASPDAPVKTDTAPQPKFTAPLIDTPKTVTVINEEVIRQTGSTSLTEALRTSPGITFGAGEGGNPVGDRPFIRGADSQSSIFMDGMRDIAARSRDVYNVESVEVIKGSDSAYAGRGGAGGSINMTTKRAKADNFFSGDVGVGTDSYKRGTIDFNRKLGETTGLRLNAMAHDADVPGRNGPTNKRWSIAPTVTFGMGTATEITLAYEHMQSDDMPDTGVPYALGFTDSGKLTVPTTIRPIYGGNRDNWYGLKARDFRKEKSDMLTAGIEHKFSDTNKIRNVLRWSKGKQDYVWTQPDDSQGNAINGQVWRRMNSRYAESKTLQNLTEFTGQAITGSVKHQFAVGLELARDESDNDSYRMVGADGSTIPNSNQCKPDGSPYMCTSLLTPNGNDPWAGSMARNNTFTHYKTRTVGLYAFDTITLTPQWLINAGLRYDRYSTKQWTSTTAFDRDDNLLNYQLGVVYKLQPNASIYASVGSASTPGGGTGGQGSESLAIGNSSTVLNADDLKPEKTRSFELGTKWDLLDKQLSLTAAIFRNETTNARIRDPLTNTSAMAGNKVVNGIELGFAGRITKQWDVFGGYTYMDSKQKNIGVTAAGVPNAGTGEAFPNTPKHSFSVWTSYKFTPQLTVGLGAFGQSSVVGGYGFGANNVLVKRGAPGFTRFDAMASYAFTKNLTLQVNVYNLSNKTYFSQAYAAHYASMAPGRSVVATLRFAY